MQETSKPSNQSMYRYNVSPSFLRLYIKANNLFPSRLIFYYFIIVSGCFFTHPSHSDPSYKSPLPLAETQIPPTGTTHWHPAWTLTLAFLISWHLDFSPKICSPWKQFKVLWGFILPLSLLFYFQCVCSGSCMNIRNNVRVIMVIRYNPGGDNAITSTMATMR